MINFIPVRRRSDSVLPPCGHKLSCLPTEKESWMFILHFVLSSINYYCVYIKHVTPQQMYYNYSKDIINKSRLWLTHSLVLFKLTAVLCSYINCNNDFKRHNKTIKQANQHDKNSKHLFTYRGKSSFNLTPTDGSQDVGSYLAIYNIIHSTLHRELWYN